ncbi:succinoglycan biosynthesis ketolase, partial [filamentous cyanobacterium CCP5]
IIFSTGAGYEQPLTILPDGWQISCVRGPLTAKRLGLPQRAAIADGGLLIRQVFQGSSAKPFPVAFMPHIHHVADAFWEPLCLKLGWRYIDPRWPVEPVLAAIDQSELLLAEAMHGAIAADALRVPWIPVHTSARILDFKWQDWCASMEVAYRPQRLPPPLTYKPVALGVRSGLRATRHWQRCWQQGRWRQSEAAIAAQLVEIAQQVSPTLSRQSVLDRRLGQLMDCLDQLQSTW